MAAIAQAPAKSTSRERWAWYMYDFGNSAYAAVVLLAVYSAYFQGAVVGGAEGTRLWGIAVGIAMLTVAVTAPILGAIADFSGAKKRFLFGFTVMSCLFTGFLYFVGEGDIVLGMVFFILAEIGYRSAQVFYNGLLPEIAEPEDIGRISGNGWAVGSGGGIICLVIVLGLITALPDTNIVRWSMVLTAVYYAASTIPTFLWLKEKAQPRALPAGENYVSVAFKRLGRTFRSARNYRELIKFIVAFLIYNDGILMALDFAAILGAVLYGMEQQELIIFMIVVQITNVIGAFVSGWAADRYNAKWTLVISLFLMAVAALWMVLNDSKTGFYMIGALAGLAIAGAQSVSRTMIGMLSPAGRSAEFYGLFAVVGRTSSFIGPTVFGIIAAEAALYYQRQGLDVTSAEQTGLRVAIVAIIIFLMVGLFALISVNEKKGREVARLESEAGD